MRGLLLFPVVYQMIQNSPPTLARLLASVKMMDKSQALLTVPVAGGISHENLSILHAAQNDKMAGESKVLHGHQRNH